MNRKVDVKALVSHIVRGDGADRCRICMGDTSEGQVYLGDTVLIDDGCPVTLAELLEIVSGVEIAEESLCPGGVCVACTIAALAAHEFKSLVTNSVTLWSSTIQTLAVIPHSAATTTSIKSICAFIRDDTLSIQIVKDDAASVPNVLNKLGTKKKEITVNRKPRVPRAGPSSTCTDCGKRFASPYNLVQHLKNSAQKEACIHCGVITLRGQGMRDHLRTVHNEKTFICQECPSLFVKESQLLEHTESAHVPGAITCCDCGRTFPKSSAFEAHTQIMHAVRTCRACGTQFTNRGCYREHRSKCEPDAKPNIQELPKNRRSNVRDPAQFTCDHCGKTYKSRPQLKNHIVWIHMDVRPYQCQWCGKRFYSAARLAEHSVVHTRVRNFECDICGAKLVSKMAAVYHKRRHTGERPYKCEDCGEMFISSSRRSDHVKRKHKKGLHFQCVECSAFFVRSHELRKHLEKTHKVPKLEPSEIGLVKESFALAQSIQT